MPKTCQQILEVSVPVPRNLVRPVHLEDIRIKAERALSTRKTEKSLKCMTGLNGGFNRTYLTPEMNRHIRQD
jgi:hypothetical protein